MHSSLKTTQALLTLGLLIITLMFSLHTVVVARAENMTRTLADILGADVTGVCLPHS